MDTQISKSKFKARALAILRRIERTGEPVTITDHGKPTLTVRPYNPGAPTPRERLKGSVIRYEDPFEPVDDENWEALV